MESCGKLIEVTRAGGGSFEKGEKGEEIEKYFMGWGNLDAYKG